MKASVSIIIPAYQNALTINRTLASVSAQSRADWEAIIACDGPTDGTVRIAQHAADRDSRFVVLDLSHAGVSHARNSAIAASKTDWLLFLDADDTVAPTFLAHMLRIARRNPAADVIACGFDRLDELGKVSARFGPLPLDRHALAVCAAGPPGAIHSFLVKRAPIVAAKGFDESLQTNEDWDLWLRLAASGVRFAITRSRLAHYWSTPNSLSRSGGQMVRDAGIVQLRAKAMNVAPYRGLEAFDHRSLTINELALRNAFWSAGVAIGQGNPTPNLFGEISQEVDFRYQKLQLATKLFDGLVVGTGTGYAELGLRWLAIREGVNVLLEGLRAHVGTPDTMDPIAQALQIEIARAGRFKDEIDLGLVVGVSLTMRMLVAGYTPRSDADLVVFRVHRLRPATMFSFAAPLFGPMTGRDVRAVVLRGITRRIGSRAADWHRTRRLFALYGRATALFRRATGGTRHEPPGMPISSAARVQAERIAVSFSSVENLPVPPASLATVHPGTSSSAEDWDRFFGTEDPWGYGSPYEQIKYQRTLSLIAPVPEGRALEIACAEGRFTEMLAGIAGSVHAIDISTTAMARAVRRTAKHPHVDFEQRDVFQQGIEGMWDVITCSEVLYFIPSREALTALARSIAAALRPGGQFVHAHAFEVGDTPGRTAFEWDDTVGADSIFQAFRSTSGLRHVRSIVTALYRIDLFMRDDGNSNAEAAVEQADIGHALEPAVAASVIWNGAVVTRKAASTERVFDMPVLLYNGVAEDDRETDPYMVTPGQFEHQLRFLRRRGYRSISPDQWQEGAARAGSLRGRPIMLTFDGLPENFDRLIWPIIQRNGFLAHIFVTEDEVSVDRGEGKIAGIASLIEAGVTFGSRLSGDVAADQLQSGELLRVGIEARLGLQRLLGTTITTVAPPCGFSDTRIEFVLTAAGYHRSFMGEGGKAPICGYEMRTPRIEITRETGIEDFARLLGRDEVPSALDLP